MDSTASTCTASRSRCPLPCSPRAELLQPDPPIRMPSGIVPGFQNSTGSTPADMLRLNMAIPPTAKPNIYGILGGDLAGFPNGRRVQDDVVTIEIRAVAGLSYPLVAPTYKPDAAAGLVTDFTTTDPTTIPVPMNSPFLSSFPYLGVPYDGFDVPSNAVPLAATPYKGTSGDPRRRRAR